MSGAWYSRFVRDKKNMPRSLPEIDPFPDYICGAFPHLLKTQISGLNLQSRPIEMRATILYLANPWTEFEMLLTPLRFLYLVMFSLLAFSSIPQFIAHFWQISSFLCIVLPFSNSYRNESCSKACSAHFAPAAILFFHPFCEWTKWRTKEGPKSSNQGYRGDVEL